MAAGEGTAAEQRWRAGLLLLGLLGAAQAARFWDRSHALDDAWISFRIARNLLEGQGLTFDATRPPVEGMSNLLWTLLSLAWIAPLPGADPIWGARLVGGLCWLGAILLGARLARQVAAAAGGDGARAGLVAGLLLASTGNLSFYAMSGLETPLWVLLWIAALERLHAGRQAVVGLLLGLLAMTRPEGVLVAGLVTLGVGLGAGGRGGMLRVGLPAALLIGGMEAFRLGYYGALVPNTFHAKPPDPGAGLRYVAAFAGQGIGGVGLLVAGGVAVRVRAARLPLAVAAVMLAGAAWSGGDWMPGFRRCALAWVTLAGLVGVAAGVGTTRVTQAAAGLAVLGWLAAQGALALGGKDRALYPHAPLVAVGRRLAQTPGVQRAALVDIGQVGWEFRGSILDLAGLTDAHIAHLPGGHAEKAMDMAYFRAQAPEVLLVRSETPVVDPLPGQPVLGLAEKPVVIDILNHGGYRLHGQVTLAPDKYLVVFRADGVVLPEALWGPEAEKDLPALLGALQAAQRQ